MPSLESERLSPIRKMITYLFKPGASASVPNKMAQELAARCKATSPLKQPSPRSRFGAAAQPRTKAGEQVKTTFLGKDKAQESGVLRHTNGVRVLLLRFFHSVGCPPSDAAEPEPRIKMAQKLAEFILSPSTGSGQALSKGSDSLRQRGRIRGGGPVAPKARGGT